MKKIVMGFFVLGAAATLVACGGGGGGADTPAQNTPNAPAPQEAKFNNYEGVWQEACTLDPYLRLYDIGGAAAYRTRTRTVQLTSPLASAALMTTFSYTDQIKVFDNNLCSGEPRLKITSPGDFIVFGGHNTTIDGAAAERASMTVYSGSVQGYAVPADGNLKPFVLNNIYFPSPSTANLTYLSQALTAKTVLQLDGAKWYFVAPTSIGDAYPTTLLKAYYLTKSK
jgi:hypothetical protein